MATERLSTENVSLPPARIWLGLLQEALQQEGRFRWVLRGTSMQPTLVGGSEIEIRPLPDPPRRGDLLVFCAGDNLIAHRLVRYRLGSLVTHGDGCDAPDPPWEPSQALGIVRAAYWHGERYWPGPWERIYRPYWIVRHHWCRLRRRLMRHAR